MRMLLFSAYLALAILNGDSAPQRGAEVTSHDDATLANHNGGATRLISLADSLAPLRDRFNADTGKPRLLAFLSPT